MNKAVFSPCENYRYTLWREWGGLFGAAGYVNFICLNPSTATDTLDDNTIRRCIRFGKKWGFSGLCITNIFAWRSTDPGVLKELVDPVGPENDHYIKECAAGAAMVIAAWSQHGALYGRGEYVRNMLANINIHYLKMGVSDLPQHPLYLSADLEPKLWE